MGSLVTLEPVDFQGPECTGRSKTEKKLRVSKKQGDPNKDPNIS